MFNRFSTLYDYFPGLEALFPWLIQEKRQAEELALQAEMIVRQLSGLPPVNSDDRDIIAVLKSTCLLLERFQDYPDLINHKETTLNQPMEDNKREKVQPPVELPSIPKILRETPEEKPSVTAQEMIKLRDWILLAKSGEGKEKVSSKVLDAIYQQLRKILEKEGFISLEETGNFNDERQKVVATQATDDPAQEDLVCDTIRPGYLFRGSLIRPQEVIVYTYSNSDSNH